MNGVVSDMAFLLQIGDILPAGQKAFTAAYLVPSGVSSFNTRIYVSTTDPCGGVFEYPGRAPAI
ncbi:MAG: hypothetical protein AB1760_13940 [Pseudomonadota bacterium]